MNCSTDQSILDACDHANAVSWKGTGVLGLDFLSEKGKGKKRWISIEKSGFRPRWDRLGRVNRAQGWEWLLVVSYESLAQATEAVQSIDVDADFVSIQEADFVSRIKVIQFLRIYGICCRLLFDLTSAGKEANSIQDVINQNQERQHSRVKNRVYFVGVEVDSVVTV